MKTLNIQYSVEIDNLIEVMAEQMGKTYYEVEKMSSEEGIFPESSTTFITTRFGKSVDEKPLRSAIYDYLVKSSIQSIYPI